MILDKLKRYFNSKNKEDIIYEGLVGRFNSFGYKISKSSLINDLNDIEDVAFDLSASIECYFSIYLDSKEVELDILKFKTIDDLIKFIISYKLGN